MQVPQEVSDDDLRGLFAPHGEILEVHRLNKPGQPIGAPPRRRRRPRAPACCCCCCCCLLLLLPAAACCCSALLCTAASPRPRPGRRRAGCAFVTFNRWSEAEAAIEALNGSFQYPAAKAKIVVKFADAKPEGAARASEKRPPGSDLPQVRGARLPCSAGRARRLLRRAGRSLQPAAAPSAAPAPAPGLCRARRRRSALALTPLTLLPPQGPNKKAFTAGLAMGNGFGPYGRGGMGMPGFGLGMGGLALNPMVRRPPAPWHPGQAALPAEQGGAGAPTPCSSRPRSSRLTPPSAPLPLPPSCSSWACPTWARSTSTAWASPTCRRSA
jgi:hypothetical protein